jgi:hypothetical protein
VKYFRERHFEWMVRGRRVVLNFNGPSKLREVGWSFGHYIPTDQWHLQVSLWWGEVYLWVEWPDDEGRSEKDINDFLLKLDARVQKARDAVALANATEYPREERKG